MWIFSRSFSLIKILFNYANLYSISHISAEGTDLIDYIFVFFYPLTSNRSGCPGSVVRD